MELLGRDSLWLGDSELVLQSPDSGGSAPGPGELGRGGKPWASRTFQDLVEAPEEYGPHFGQVEGDLLQGGPGDMVEVGQGFSVGMEARST